MAKGSYQREGLNYEEIFSPVIKLALVQLILSIVLCKGWKICQFDFNNVFLNGDLAQEVFIQQSEVNVSLDPRSVCRLHKALYGLKQAPRAWFSKLSCILRSFGFSPIKCDASLFT